MLHRPGDRPSHTSETVRPDGEWRRVELFLSGGDEEHPFGDTVLGADGEGEVWFDEMCFEPL
jgi:hypothetical protein